MALQFQWDDTKARTNVQKHGVSFEEAKTVFDDPSLFTVLDEGHSDVEERFISLGLSVRGRVLLVIHTDRDAMIRIISSRKATKSESVVYEHRS